MNVKYVNKISSETIFLTQPEISNWIKVSKSTVYKWVKDGQFPRPVMLGKPEKNGTARWIRSDIIQWLSSRPREKVQANETK
tara:strand:- start:152 stop:397 length:246 start_codon:yes stop_codon:yes gene_type:complete